MIDRLTFWLGPEADRAWHEWLLELREREIEALRRREEECPE